MAVVTWHVAYLSLQAKNLHGSMGIDLDTGYVLGHPWSELLRSGALAITMFFALSGYLISRPFVRAYVHGARRPRLRRYALNRVLRIYPVFLTVCAVTLAIYGLKGATAGQTAGVLLLTDHAGPGWTFYVVHSWSLMVEVAFYGSLPLGLLFLRLVTPARVPAPWRAAIAAAFVTSLAALSLALHWTGAIYATLPAEFWSFVPGVLLAIAEPFAAPAFARWGRGGARAGVYATLAGLALLAAFLPLVRVAGGGAGKVLAAVGCGLVVGGPLAAQWSGARPWRILDNAPLRWLGERSYSIYMVHWVIGLELAGGFVGSLALGPKKLLLVMWLVTLALTLPLAELLHRAVERPALRRKLPTLPRLSREPAGEPAPVLVVAAVQPPEPAPVPATAPPG